jgi:predicted nucleotidyltransferase component of viral defense system
MAPLSPAHWETVTPLMRQLLSELGGSPWMEHFYLAGGTALALRLGHRRSIDLDFFSATDPIDGPSRRRIRASLRGRSPEAVEDVDGNLLLRVGDALHLAFLSYGHPLIDEPEVLEGVRLASMRDVGLMKLDAVIGRGSRKDYYDLHAIARAHPLESLLDLASAKYPYARDFPLMALESLLRFENADRDRQPDMLSGTSWPEVRSFFVAEARRLGESWLGERGGDTRP